MKELVAPWSALRNCAASVDLWPVLERLGCSPERADPSAWLAAGLPARILPRLAMVEAEDDGQVRWLTAGSARWPASLRGLPFGPVALSWEGNLELLDRPGVAVVGARACTPYGRGWARRIAAAVVAADGVVVSGLARGIDAEAHAAAGGRTIAVLGQGLSARMPAWQSSMRARLLAAGGLVLSEFAGRSPAGISTFPIRNRIIAGLSRAVVVVEAAQRSGARTTAAHALRAGRDVLAVPGSLDAPASVGCLELIAEGAQIVLGPQCVLDSAGLRLPSRFDAGIPSELTRGGRRLPAPSTRLEP